VSSLHPRGVLGITPRGCKSFSSPFLIKQVTIILMNKPQKYRLRTVITLILAVVLVGGSLWYWQTVNEDDPNQENQTKIISIINQDKKPEDLSLLMVARIIDGDTLELEDGRRVRILGIDAEELYFDDFSQPPTCRALEAKNFLETLILDKKVELEFEEEKEDRYGRLLAHVRYQQELISQRLVSECLADLDLRGQVKYEEELKGAVPKVNFCQKKLEQVCPEEVCLIKGNIGQNGRYYHLPEDLYYDKVVVNYQRGESWFCSPRDAEEAGFVRAGDW
jgi:endonuclease YncB( thermonuclease family)